MTSKARYDGKPLLRLLECYVLWVIKELPEKDATTLKEMTPKLQLIYGRSGAWHQVIASVMELPSNMPALIQQMWAKNTDIARTRGVNLSPEQFAEMFVDQNLAN